LTFLGCAAPGAVTRVLRATTAEIVTQVAHLAGVATVEIVSQAEIATEAEVVGLRKIAQEPAFAVLDAADSLGLARVSRARFLRCFSSVKLFECVLHR